MLQNDPSESGVESTNHDSMQAQPVHNAKALYDYTRQTDEEVSFSEDVEILVYDTSDPDWTLVGVKDDYGFAPANYIEILEDVAPTPAGIPPSASSRTRTSGAIPASAAYPACT